MFMAEAASRRAGSSPSERMRRRMITTIVEINPIPLAFGLAQDANYLVFLAAGAHRVFDSAQAHVVSSTWPRQVLQDTDISIYGPEVIKPRTNLGCSSNVHTPELLPRKRDQSVSS